MLRHTSAFVLAWFISCAPIGAQTNGVPRGKVMGHVFCSDSHTPCRFAGVTIQSVPLAAAGNKANHPSLSYSAATDMDGAFVISNVASGEYYVQARSPGYLSPTDLVASEVDPNSTLYSKALDAALNKISVDDGMSAMVTLSLTRAASLGGAVVYDDGAPAIGIEVRLYRKDSKGAWQHYVSAGLGKLELASMTTHTDDHGHFYKTGLGPGSYAVEASLPEIILVPDAILGEPGLNVTWTDQDALRIYSGNKYRLREASAVDVQNGEYRNDVDLTIPISGLHTLEGTVTSKATGQNIGYGAVRLLDPIDQQILRQTPIQKDGSFGFHYILNGSYLVEVEATGATDNTAQQRISYEMLDSPLMVESDVLDLSYTLSQSSTK